MDYMKLLADAGVSEDIASRVLAGNALLDSKLPEDWFQHVENVEISDLYYCVAGQLGDYYDGKLPGLIVREVADYRQSYSNMLQWLDTPYEYPSNFGFDASGTAYDNMTEAEEMRDLSDAWNLLLEARRTISQ